MERSAITSVEEMTNAFIREAIIQGAFRPGQRLNLDVIAETLGVSRMPVRASLRRLEAEGMVRINRYRGVTVAVLEPAEIAEIYDMRMLLEPYLLKLAIGSLDDAFLDESVLTAAAVEDARDPGERYDRRSAMYTKLYERAGRPRVLAQVNSLRGAVGRYRLLHHGDEKHGHGEFVALLRRRDAAAAETWLVAHLAEVSARLQAVAVIETQGAPA